METVTIAYGEGYKRLHWRRRHLCAAMRLSSELILTCSNAYSVNQIFYGSGKCFDAQEIGLCAENRFIGILNGIFLQYQYKLHYLVILRSFELPNSVDIAYLWIEEHHFMSTRIHFMY